MTMFPGPDPEINNNNYYYNSSSSSYGFDGGSCFFHSNHQLGLMNYQVLEQEGYDYNCCSTTPQHHHHHQYQAAAAACCLVGSSSSSSDLPPPPPQNQNHNHNHIEVVVVGPMADQEDESRTETESTTVNEELAAAAAGTSTSKDDRIQTQIINVQDHHHHPKDIQEEEEEGWLQLSIGSSHHLENDQSRRGLVQVPRRRRRSITRCKDKEEEEEEDRHQFIELDLLPPGEGEGGLTGGTASSQYSQPPPQPTIRRRSSSTLSLAPPSSSSAIFHHHLSAEVEAEADDHPHHDYFPPPAAAHPLIATTTTSSSSLFLQQYYPGLGTNSSSLSFPAPPHPHLQDHINSWAFRSSPNNNSIIINPTNYNNIASSSLMPPVLPSSYFSTRPFQLLHGHGHATTPTFDFRVVDPPRRPHSGIWFMLQASRIQAKEPFLPQIPKSYLRIKDGRMTVRFIIKYLVNKLRLDSETEIEIRCRGQQLVPFLTLQHVRECVWMTRPSPMDTTTPPTSSSDHLMVLHYGRMS